jgi:hypothetical protein
MDEYDARVMLSDTLAKAGGNLAGTPIEGRLDEVAAALVGLWAKETEAAQTPGGVRAFLPMHYVIPDGDLKLLETCFAVLTAGGSIGFLMPTLGASPPKAVAAAVVALLVAVMKLLQNLRLAVRLEPLDHAIVLALARAGPGGLELDALAQEVRHAWPDADVPAVVARLSFLTACATLSGTKASLVWRDDAGTWRVNGL